MESGHATASITGNASGVGEHPSETRGARSPRRPRVTRPGLVLADRIALVALAGIIVSLATWVAFAWVDAVVLLQGAFRDEVLFPTSAQTLVRLGTVVLVLVGTLIIQVIYSRRMQAEERLRLAEARILQMYENSPDTVACIGPDHVIAYANAAAQNLAAGFEAPHELTGEVCYRALWGHEQPCVGCLLPDVLAKAEVRNRTVSDTVFGRSSYLEQIVYPVVDEHGVVETVVESTRDTTERVVAERMIRQMAHEDA